jgi:iron complex outermembrane recepter protein
MNKNYFLFLVAVLIFGVINTSNAQTNYTKNILLKASLSGKVTAAGSGLALPSASIYIPDLKMGTTTDANGNYIIHNIPQGNYLVQAGYVGYQNMVKKITLNENTTADFVLEIAVTEESEIVITGSSKATTIRRNPIPIISISKQYLQQNLSTNIIDAIARVPGVSAVTTGPNVSKPFIRGLGFNRILTLYDGVRQEGQQWGDEHGIEVDQNTVDKVEVVKGPASLIYGSDAVAGVVNLLPANPPPDGKTIGNISTEYQTNNGLTESSAMIAGNKHSINWMGRGSFKAATNYRNSIDGRVYNTGFRELDFSGSAGINRSWGYSHLGVSTFNDLQEIPDGSRDSASRRFTKQISDADTLRPIVSNAELSSYKITPLHQRVQHYRIYSANNFILGKSRLEINLAYQKNIRQEFSHPQIPVAGLYLTLNTFTYDAKFYFAEKNGWSITAGLNGMYQTNNVDKGTEFIIPSYNQFDAGPFLFAKKTINKLELAGGVRYDVRQFNNQALYTKPDAVTGFDKPVYGADTVGAANPFYAYKHTFSGASGSFGMSYRFSDHLTGKANLGRGYRAPNISEISANGIHPGTNSFQRGNLNFKPEFNWQEDVGLSYFSKHVTIDASVFDNNIKNYIYNQKVSSSTNQNTVIDTFQFQSSRANLYGGELSVDIHPHPLDWLHFENSLSVVYGNNEGPNNQVKVADSAKYLPLIPPFHTFSELRANIKKVTSTITNAFVKVQLEYYAPQNRAYLAYNTETRTPGYHLFNAGVGGDITNSKGHTILTFALLGDNLLNLAYQSNMNRLKYFEPYPNDPRPYHGVYNMGRNFSIKINVPLNFN